VLRSATGKPRRLRVWLRQALLGAYALHVPGISRLWQLLHHCEMCTRS
jgi:hypothetical protein